MIVNKPRQNSFYPRYVPAQRKAVLTFTPPAPVIIRRVLAFARAAAGQAGGRENPPVKSRGRGVVLSNIVLCVALSYDHAHI